MQGSLRAEEFACTMDVDRADTEVLEQMLMRGCQAYADCPSDLQTLADLMRTTSSADPAVEQALQNADLPSLQHSNSLPVPTNSSNSNSSTGTTITVANNSPASTTSNSRNAPGAGVSLSACVIGDTTNRLSRSSAPNERELHVMATLPRRPHICLNIDIRKDIIMTNNLLGTGSIGRVYLALYLGRVTAVKLLESFDLTPDEVYSMQHELKILSRVEHPNVVEVYGGNLRPPMLFLVQELLDTNLDVRLHESAEKLTLHQALKIAMQILSALAYLHSYSVVHRDIKPSNIFLNSAGVAKLGDFGLARFKFRTYLTTHNVHAGTVAYMAPECFDEKLGKLTQHCDIFSVGVLLWELVTGLRPWHGLDNLNVIFNVVMKGERLPLPAPMEVACPEEFAARLWKLIARCWVTKPLERPSAAEVLAEVTAIYNDLPSNEKEAAPSVPMRSLAMPYPAVPWQAVA